MKVGKASTEKKPRKKREIGGANAKEFIAEVTFRGKQNGESFKSTQETKVKASTMVGAAGRAVRETFGPVKAERKGKCKWTEITVIVYPAN